MKRIACVLWLILATTAMAKEPDDCSLKFRGRARKVVKLRSPTVAVSDRYEVIGTREAPKSVQFFFDKGCELEGRLPREVPKAAVMDLEKGVVTLQAFVLAVRYETILGLGGDRDFHIELSDSPDWTASKHVIVEVPPGCPYCDARKAIWQLAKDDAAASGKPLDKTHIFQNPPKVQVVGFIFFDKGGLHDDHGDCHASGGRGISRDGQPSMVQGLWELHPVIEVRKVE